MSDPKIGEYVALNEDGNGACGDDAPIGALLKVVSLPENHFGRFWGLEHSVTGEHLGLFVREEFDYPPQAPSGFNVGPVQVDMVNHPPHYKLPNGIEVIDITENLGFRLGNTVKYILRADAKGAPIEDLKKARWYLDREITTREA